ncbi:MAG: ABC transporter ATP-binding protein [Candidatus Thermoplasmatota archaeon]|nr:ABC transporter ATP-binding protein [Candidatus Thermoplasmatota archaeon]MBS3789410.1 ABC transporter ATP-binding protein [Candidatus Thermoplasmatota archaeon]
MILEIKDLNFSYDGHEKVLEDVSISLERGNILAIIGPNGSGKTTLLKCIGNILIPQKGSIDLDGESLDSYERQDIARKIGYVPQVESRGFPSTVYDTILMGRKPYISWEPSEKDLKIVSQIIRKLGLESISMKEINELSGGQRQKVFVGRALAQQPNLLLLDEPTSDLDLKHKLEVLNIIRHQVDQGISAILAIHDLNMALRYSDRIVMLKEGSVYDSGGLDVVTQENIESVYGVKVYITEHESWLTVTPDKPVDGMTID